MTTLRDATLAEVERALADAEFDPPHADVSGLPKPYQLAIGDVAIEEIKNPRGTIVVVGSLALEGDLDARQVSGLANIVVTGDMSVRHAYFDAFLVVGGTLSGGTIIADSNWNGGLFAGDVHADTLVLKDCGLDFIGEQTKPSVKRLADFEDESAAREAVPELFTGDDVDAYAFFLALKR